MKRFIIIVVLLILVSGFALAQEPTKPFLLDAGGGIYYDATPVPAGALGIIAALFNLRGELYGSFSFMFTDMVGVGAEVGVAYITATIGTDSFSLIDVPLRVMGNFDLKFVTLQPYVGVLFTIQSSSANTVASPNLEAGARLLIGSQTGVYAEAGYVIGATSFPRFGLGFQAKLFAF